MRKISLALIMLTLVCSCSKEKQNKEDNGVNQTPEALQNDSDISLRSYGKRYDTNIIEKLYQEALEKDISLKKLNESFLLIGKEKRDSLINFDNYVGNNNKYWGSVEGHLNNIKDSVLRKEIAKDFKVFEVEYNKSISSLKEKDSIINKKSKLLSDYHEVMKLKVSHNMMRIYNKNEFPKEDNHIYVSKKYDTLIEKAKKQVKQ